MPLLSSKWLKFVSLFVRVCACGQVLLCADVHVCFSTNTDSSINSAHVNGNNPNKAGNNPNKTGNNPNKAGNNPNKAGNNPNKAGNNPNKAGNIPPRSMQPVSDELGQASFGLRF